MSYLCQVLKERTRIIMMRTFGNMREATSYQQHLNPACRVARSHAYPLISRLLPSIQDVDVPLESDIDRHGVLDSPGHQHLLQPRTALEFCGHLPSPRTP